MTRTLSLALALAAALTLVALPARAAGRRAPVAPVRAGFYAGYSEDEMRRLVVEALPSDRDGAGRARVAGFRLAENARGGPDPLVRLRVWLAGAELGGDGDAVTVLAFATNGPASPYASARSVEQFLIAETDGAVYARSTPDGDELEIAVPGPLAGASWHVFVITPAGSLADILFEA